MRYELLAAGLAGLAFATLADASHVAGTPDVVIVGAATYAQPAPVAPGSTVTVFNSDLLLTHTVTSGLWRGVLPGLPPDPLPEQWLEPIVGPGATATFTAPGAPGAYPYFCRFHPWMRGTLVVA